MEKINGTILISDTNKGLLTALVLLLQKHFSNVITEADYSKVMEMAQGGNVDVVILDAGANSSAGRDKYLEHVKKIALCGHNVQVIALTNFGQSQFALELAQAGAFDFVPKPWNNEKLLVTLRNACSTRQLLNAVMEKRLSGRKDSEEGISDTGKPATLEQMEKRMMKAAIKRNRGNISNAAEELGITRQTLYNKGRKYKLFE